MRGTPGLLLCCLGLAAAGLLFALHWTSLSPTSLSPTLQDLPYSPLLSPTLQEGPVSSKGPESPPPTLHSPPPTAPPTPQLIFCWILTGEPNHKGKAFHVQQTWARHCDGYAFMSSREDAELGAVDVGVGEGRDRLWAKTKAAFTLLHHNYSAFHWYLKADDDTYVVLHNLRHFLAPYHHSRPLYFGAKFVMSVKNGQGYMSGGAGYVLSREAVRLFVEEALPNTTSCSPSEAGDEDVEMGKCLENVGVEAVDTRDELGRLRFLPCPMANLLFPEEVDGSQWITHYSGRKVHQGWNCCSEDVISIHNVKPKEMYLFEYLIYRFKLHT